MQAFRARLRGALLEPSDAEYERARRVWNGMIDRSPAAIARCATGAEVADAIGIAREHDLPLAVRGGGHNIAGYGTCDDGVVIDLSPMRAVRVDPARRVARVEGGAVWGDLDRATQRFGLATTGGTVTDTGVAGLTLGGGQGWLMARHGLSCDNLRSVELVTADGRTVIASADENAELFWGLRGGGGNFGVATALEFDLHAVDTVLGGYALFPLARVRDVFDAYQALCAASTDDFSANITLLTDAAGRPAVSVSFGWCGPLEDGERLLAPLRRLGPTEDHIAPRPYLELQSMLDTVLLRGNQHYWKACYVPRIDDDLLDLCLEHHARITSPLSMVILMQFHGAASRVPAHATAFGFRQEQWELEIITQWRDAAEDPAPHLRWTRDFNQAAQPFTSGHLYVNHMAADEGGRVRAAYDQDAYARLVRLKNEYDPTTLFRINQNIVPTA